MKAPRTVGASFPTPRRAGLGAALGLGLGLLGVPGPAPAAESVPAEQRVWVEEMKRAPRGPFSAIRWFCRDGTVLPPGPGACTPHGGGIQHGTWNERARSLRAGGSRIANVLAAVDPAEFVGANADLDGLAQILLERFLVAADDGWIFRGARTYRGALQAEDETAGARRLLLAMLADPRWSAPSRYLLLRESVRLLPLDTDDPAASKVRQLSAELAELDPRFAPLRNQIHGLPSPADAERVRHHASTGGKAELAPRYAELAAAIDALHQPGGAEAALERIAASLRRSEFSAVLRELAARLAASGAPAVRLALAAEEGASLRESLFELARPEERLAALQAGVILESAAFTAASAVSAELEGTSRRKRLVLLEQEAVSLYAAGLLSSRELGAQRDALAALRGAPRVTVGYYRGEVAYFGRLADWCARSLEFHFGGAIARFARLEPLAHTFVPDRLRGSPLLFLGRVLDDLVLDANTLAGVRHSLFGRGVGVGLRALNPGLARGVLQVGGDEVEQRDLSADAVALLPHTVADLPPVAGILTRGEGSSLSHVQLLARNLGIPNVVVGEQWLPALRERTGQRIVLAVSPRGVVEIAEDGPRWDAIFGGTQPAASLRIRPDLAKLDLNETRLLSLDAVRAVDSGRIVGPKAANLGELRHAFGAAVPDGLVIPFGVFRRLLDQPLEPGGPPVFQWMREQYAALRSLDEEPRRAAARVFLARLRSWIEQADAGQAFRDELRRALTETFGPGRDQGVFVRSDTNVEDLPGFTGAGLNLTVPHAVGFEAIAGAISRVWASPFTERAYAWRQAHMDEPEYVFPGILLMRSVPSEKSGVMVTAEVETGSSAWLSIAVNEGVGGAVEGQAAEELRVRRATGEVRLLAQATAPRKAALAPGGGLAQVPASGAEVVLARPEIERLRQLADELPKRFPSLRAGSGQAAAADVEFAFVSGELVLLQIRPFVESRRAQRTRYLQRLSRGVEARAGRPVDLDAAPRGPSG